MPKEKAIEQELASMERAIRKDTAPSLYDEDHDVGFQILESDDDEQRAVGVHVFRLGKDLWLYAPIFFNKGQLLGDELLLIKNHDMFVPFEEDWVNFLLSKEPFLLGKAQKQTDKVKGTEPDFAPFTKVPSTGPGISIGEVKGAALFADVRQCAKLAATGGVDLKSAIEEADEGAKHGMRLFMLQNTKLAEYIAGKFPNILESLRPVDDSWYKSAAEAEPEVRVVTSMDEALTSVEKLAVIQQGLAVIDNRTESAKTRLAATSSDSFFVPERTGFYTVEGEDGPFTALVLAGTRGFKTVLEHASPSPTLSVLKWGANKVYDRHPRALAAYGDSEKVSWREQWESLPEDTRVSKGARYLFIGPDEGKTYGPTSTVDEVVGFPEGGTLLKTEVGKDILLTSARGEAPVEQETRVVLPVSWRPVRIKPGTLQLKGIEEILHTSGRPVHVKRAATGLVFECNGERTLVTGLDKALRLFIEKYAMAEPDARQMYEAALRGRKLFILKAGQLPAGLGFAPPQGASATPLSLPPAMQEATQIAQTALAGGQSDIVDTSALSSMLSTSDSAQYIRKFLGDLLTAVDRLGRILFVMYSKDEEFQESFGSQELEDLRDDIINAFKALGKVVLKLRERLSSPAELSIFE